MEKRETEYYDMKINLRKKIPKWYINDKNKVYFFESLIILALWSSEWSAGTPNYGTCFNVYLRIRIPSWNAER